LENLQPHSTAFPEIVVLEIIITQFKGAQIFDALCIFVEEY